MNNNCLAFPADDQTFDIISARSILSNTWGYLQSTKNNTINNKKKSNAVDVPAT